MSKQRQPDHDPDIAPDEPENDPAAAVPFVDQRILTRSEHAKLSQQEKEEFRRNNGTVTEDPA